eukprot:4479099-Pyramimonas_sp.AAC.1
MSLKAAEVGYMLPFAIDTLTRYSTSVGALGGALLHGGVALERFLEIMRAHPTVIPYGPRIEMVQCISRHLRCCEITGINFTPKHHLICHLVLRWPWGVGGRTNAKKLHAKTPHRRHNSPMACSERAWGIATVDKCTSSGLKRMDRRNNTIASSTSR